ncbi:MAG TPA: GMC family oxidoreductase N-terminal domain-containing protein [Candidatus Dormibacteraeota bacterium]|nr:GMC family oxidoreductase N-terminal domain-containing protein [Candidatus Dormibacteraeota bacterium]
MHALIVGSGPAAAGAALALARRPDVRITVLDLGLRLEPERRRALEELSGREPEGWDGDMVRLISTQPVDSRVSGLPEKRAYGSDFPFRDLGQLGGVNAATGVHRALVSAAYGGFSNVWGSQLMPFTAATFETWPVSATEMEPHYRAVLDRIPFAGEEDDLGRLFPLIGRASPLPRLSDRSVRVLAAYDRHRSALNRMGVSVGRARLAFQADACTRCGLCMTGCPYGLIYSAAQTFDALRRSGRIAYHSGLMAYRVSERGERVAVRARELAGGELRCFEGDRLYVACGALGTTRLVLGSLGLYDREVRLAESAQFTVPMLSARAARDPREEAHFTLNQFNMVVELDAAGLDVSQLHYYAYNPAFTAALPAPLRADPFLRPLLRRLAVGIGYLPSWASPGLTVRARSAPDGELAVLSLERERPTWGRNRMLRTVLARLVRAAPLLDLYPLLPRMILAAGGKSYHFGSSFPLAAGAPTERTSDRLGRVGPWRRIHLVDAAVFPNVPATTFTLTIMANAHRIAAESLEAQR